MQLTVQETPTQAIERVKAKIHIRSRYENFIGGQWVPPVKGQYFQNITPINGQVVLRGRPLDRRRHRACPRRRPQGARAWGKTSPAERADALLNRIADRMEANLELLAMVETIDNGKPIRETMAADMPLAVDHFRYFAGCIRAQEGSIAEIDDTTVAYHFHEPLGVVGQIIPVELPAADGRAGSWLPRSPPATASC